MARVNDPYHRKLVEEHCQHYRFWVVGGSGKRMVKWGEEVWGLRGERILFCPNVGKVFFKLVFSSSCSSQFISFD